MRVSTLEFPGGPQSLDPRAALSPGQESPSRTRAGAPVQPVPDQYMLGSLENLPDVQPPPMRAFQMTSRRRGAGPRP